MKTPRVLGLLAMVTCGLGLVGAVWAQGTIYGCGAISAPGLWQLAANISASGTCLVITANDVTLDLSGFEIVGDRTGSCISDGGTSLTGTVIKNGTVRNCVL